MVGGLCPSYCDIDARWERPHSSKVIVRRSHRNGSYVPNLADLAFKRQDE